MIRLVVPYLILIAVTIAFASFIGHEVEAMLTGVFPA